MKCLITKSSHQPDKLSCNTSPYTHTRFFEYGREVSRALTETLWPTRCAICESPGEVLCTPCCNKLSYLDWWRACPQCGAPFGRVQCSECNDIMLKSACRDTFALNGHISALTLDEGASRLVRTWKDGGERRIGQVMATLMARCMNPAWLARNPVVITLPASQSARHRRGFDHGEELAGLVATALALPHLSVLSSPKRFDQRMLGRRERIANMDRSLRCLPGASIPEVVLIIDDVYTTGSTLFAAADALRTGGAYTVYGLTFARTW